MPSLPACSIGKMIEPLLARLLFSTRWLLAPFYLLLAVGLLALLGKAGFHAFTLMRSFADLSEADVILGALALVDLTLTASLVVIVIVSGYVNFVARVDSQHLPDWPSWMGRIDFSELKLKVMASIVAIAAIKLLESFMDVGHASDRDLWAQCGLLLVLVFAGFLMALGDWLGQAQKH